MFHFHLPIFGCLNDEVSFGDGNEDGDGDDDGVGVGDGDGTLPAIRLQVSQMNLLRVAQVMTLEKKIDRKPLFWHNFPLL